MFLYIYCRSSLSLWIRDWEGGGSRDEMDARTYYCRYIARRQNRTKTTTTKKTRTGHHHEFITSVNKNPILIPEEKKSCIDYANKFSLSLTRLSPIHFSVHTWFVIAHLHLTIYCPINIYVVLQWLLVTEISLCCYISNPCALVSFFLNRL